MAIEDMFHALEAQADQQCREITAEATARADAIIRDAEEQSARIRERKLEEADSAARAKASHAVNAARLANKKDAAELKGEAVGDVFALAGRGLSKVRGSKEYEKLFSALLAQAADCAAGEECDVLVDPTDVDLAGRAVAVLGRNGMTVKGDIETGGGVVVTTDGGRVLHRNTVESRLDKVRGAAQSRVVETLFD